MKTVNMRNQLEVMVVMVMVKQNAGVWHEGSKNATWTKYSG